MRFFLLPVVILAAGCGPGPEAFPVGIFDVKTPADVRAVAAQGFDAVQSYRAAPDEVAALTAAARSEKQLILIPPGGVEGAVPARGFPGVYWYLRDEPETSGVDADQLAALEKQVDDWAPGAKTAFVVGDGRRAKDYPGVGTAIMVDWYPVPHLPLESAGDNVRMTKEAAGTRKVWAVLQAMDWRDFPQRDPKKKRIGRFPEMWEIRFMSYDAVLNGAMGIWYYTYSTATGSNLSQSPELFERVVKPAQEMRAMAPIFARGRPIPLPYAPSTDADAISGKAWTYHGRDYVVLEARKGGQDALVPEMFLDGSWRPLFETRRDPKELLWKFSKGYFLSSHHVLVLESRLRLKRLLGR